MSELIEIIENYSEADEIIEKSSLKNDLGLSSFDIVCLIEDIDSTFGVCLSPKDFAKHKTVGEIFSCISENRVA